MLATVLARLSLVAQVIYLVGGVVLGLTWIRHQTWMVLSGFLVNFPLAYFASYVGYRMALAHEPDKYAAEANRSRRADLFKVHGIGFSYDLRDAHLTTYLPAWRYQVALQVLLFTAVAAEFVSVVSKGQRLPFSSVAPLFALVILAFLNLILPVLRAARRARARS